MIVICALQIRNAAARFREVFGKAILVAAFVFVGACTAKLGIASDGRLTPSGDLEIYLSREDRDGRPVLTVSITNISENDICVTVDALRNPDSGEMYLTLRDSRGRALDFYPPGFVIPPLEGVVIIEPGRTVEGFYYLNTRFRQISADLPFPNDLSAQVSFIYDYCDNTWRFRAVSSLQSI